MAEPADSGGLCSLASGHAGPDIADLLTPARSLHEDASHYLLLALSQRRIRLLEGSALELRSLNSLVCPPA